MITHAEGWTAAQDLLPDIYELLWYATERGISAVGAVIQTYALRVRWRQDLPCSYGYDHALRVTA